MNIVNLIDGNVKINHVLISVSDKTGLDILIPGLLEVHPGIKIYSTGGTYKKIKEILTNSAVVDSIEQTLIPVSDYTGQPEMQGGLVKTLDFKIYLGLLSETYNDAHKEDLERTGAVPIDMVVSNLYPFSATIAQPDVTPEQARANIDIGGPCMVRASAKNFLRVASVTDPGEYGAILQELKNTGGYLSLDTRQKLATKAFTHTAHYDKTISDYFMSINFKDIESCYTVK
jgi:phosphoribosylaminoimidazolecarboxamide formyltransferase / IMP cyclohydrolase